MAEIQDDRPVMSRLASGWKPALALAGLYVVVWLMFVIFMGSVLGMIGVIQWFATMVLVFCFLGLTMTAKNRRLPSLALVFAIGLSCLIILHPAIYTRPYNALRPCPEFEAIIDELHNGSSSLEPGHKYNEMVDSLQAQGLDNVHMKRLGVALNWHFDRYALNQTQRFAYVESLNLLANIFDDDGVQYIVEALEHEYAYTTMLLLGRNRNVGDDSARKLANLIKSRDPIQADADGSISPHPGEYLTWLHFGGTSVTQKGLQAMFEALGTRWFEFLGLEYTKRSLLQRMIVWWRFNPVRQSVSMVKEAKLLQEFSLPG